MKKIILLIFIALPLLMISSGADAQYSWTMTHSDSDSEYYYSFMALSCSGNNCTAVGQKYKVRYGAIFFWHSTDGGMTWVVQDPGVEYTGNDFIAIQQIDSLNVVAVADSGLMLRTFDGGVTWEKQDCNTTHTLWDVHFSDPLTGIVVSNGPIPIHTTTDGGKHWTDAPFADNILDVSYFTSCHSYGNGKFRAFRRIFGPLYTTTDNWKTIDSTKPLVDTVNDPEGHCYFIYHCAFGKGDTMIAYGLVNINCQFHSPLIMRSTDGGKTWGKPSFNYAGPIGRLDAMTSLDRDTILAGGHGFGDYLQSTDNGISWNNQIITVPNISPTTQPDVFSGLVWAANDHPLAIVKSEEIQDAASVIVRGDPVINHVDIYENIVWNTFIYPNPGTTTINIITPATSRQIYVIDMLGREVMHGMISEQGKITLDVSNISRGIYDLLLQDRGRMIPIGKVAVLGK